MEREAEVEEISYRSHQIGITKKYVGVDLDVNHRNEPSDGAICGDVDGPRYRDGRSAA